MSLYDRIVARAERSDILFHTAKAVQLGLLNVKGALSFGRSRVLDDYLDTHAVRKLQLGSGPKLLEGWLNTDCSLVFPANFFLDVTKRFPFPDATFDYVFTEHLIEHLDYSQGRAMLRECFRVLVPGGRIRVSCPDLSVILDLHRAEKTPAQDRYIRIRVEGAVADRDPSRDAFVVNNAFRNWGHKFLYDQEALTAALQAAGFAGVTRFPPTVSDDPNLRGLESHGSDDEDEAKCFESQVLEAAKPRAASR
ncbi:MAG TPA: methyltransferase domain-containing protein [Acidimicrobiia bacterium]|nr:methyltransferase domain-containing protein [Acidimicrobiia bacterium]